ncbi:Bromodomain-containing protein [Pyronema omphalodes]|nr:Bromodomain-containing protein [Pyronema omphalodes]
MQTQSFIDGTEDVPMDGSQNGTSEKPATESNSGSTVDASKPVVASIDEVMQDVASKKSPRDRDDDEDEDRPQKRAKTDVTEPAPATASTATSTEYSGPLTPARAKHALAIIRSLRRTKDARPFSMPVDAVKLNVPTYYEIITKPMDLQTMERKLNNNEYTDVESFVQDFKQILENCMIFNGPGHAVTIMSQTMENAFNRQMKELPGEDVVEVEKPKASKKKGTGQLSGAAAASHNKATAAKSGKKEPKTAVASPAATSPVFSLQPSGMPQIRRDSTFGDRPKREIHPPAPKDLPYSTKPRRKQNAAELKFCDQVLKELNKKVHEAYAFPFYHPVDPVALNIPDYFKIIKKPMDLSTIADKLKLNSYENASEFEQDMRLMFNNCYKFNPPDQAVHQMGRKLEGVFDQKWKDKPLYTQGSRSPQSASPAPYNDEMSEEEEGENDKVIEDLESKLEKMKEEILSLKGKKKTPPVQQNKSKSSASKARKGSTSNASMSSKSKKAKIKDVPHISLEQKTELSERINLLPAGKMHYALLMIKEMMPNLGNDGSEIELDIDELDPHTLFKLYKYVSKNAPEIPAKYVPPPPPPPEREEMKSKPKAGTKGRKNKPMTAAEQEAKIADMKNRLQMFDNPGYTPPVPAAPGKLSSFSVLVSFAWLLTTVVVENPDSESSDDDESSASESEEE